MDRQTIETLAGELSAKQKAARVAEHSTVYEPKTTTATSLGYACDRRLVYGRCFPRDAEPFGEELLSIFSEGDLHQKDVRAELARIGYEVVEAEVRFSDKRYDIAGTIDGKIALAGNRDTHTQKRIPIEIKSTAGHSPADENALRNSSSGLLRRYYAQMQVYLFLTSEQFGIFIFKNKITGLWSTVVVELDYAFAETLLQRAERVRDAVALVETSDNRDERLALLPARVTDRGECIGCQFANTLCHPADAPVDPMLIAMEPELLAQLTEREKLSDASDRYADLDKHIKDRLKLTAFERLVVGGADGFMIEKNIAKNNSVRFKISRLGNKTIENT